MESEPGDLDWDPYWRMPAQYIHPTRLQGLFRRFEKQAAVNLQWAEDLESGLPTYYCILGVRKEAALDEVEKAYQRKKEFSVYPDSAIEAAYAVLKNPCLRWEYESLLSLFESICRGLNPREKREIKEEHDSWLAQERDFIKMRRVREKHENWEVFYRLGAPTFYELAGLDRNASFEDIQSARGNASQEVLDEARSILLNPEFRGEYDLMLSFTERYMCEEFLEEIEEYKKQWNSLKPEMRDRIALTILKNFQEYKQQMDRWIKIVNENPDWQKYLPPEKKSFYSILNIIPNSLPADKREIEAAIRAVYRDLEKTSEVNLAYSVLKNSILRSNYDFMLQHHELMKQLHELLMARRPSKEDIEEMRREIDQIFKARKKAEREEELCTT